MINWMISSSCLILIVLMVRRLFAGKVSLRLQYALWLLVAVRLLIPINLGNSAISIENFINHISAQEQIEEIVKSEVPEISVHHNTEGIKIYDSIEEIRNEEKGNLQESEQLKEQLEVVPQNAPFQTEATKKEILNVDILMGIWMIGMTILSCIFLVSNLIFARKLKKSRNLLGDSYGKLPVYESAVIDTPCLFGIFRPAIYVTPNVAKDPLILRHAVCHEQSHYQQGDLFWAPLRCVCLLLHWYNPFVWWAVKVSKQDAELACDEATIRKLGEEERLSYGKTLIQLTCEKQSEFFLTATTMTTGKRSIKERIERIAKAPNFKLYAFLGVVLVAAIAVGCTFTGAKNEEKNETISEAPVRGIPCEDPKASGWNLSLAEDVRENFHRMSPNPEEGTADAVYLLGESANHGYVLYGKGDYQTMLVYMDGKYAEIAFPYASNYMELPRLIEKDIDRDGEMELCIILWLQHGTGLHVENLLLADFNEEGQLYVYEFVQENYTKQLQGALSYEITEEGIQPFVDDQPAGRMSKHLEDMGAYTGASVGNQMRFDCDPFTGEVRLRGDIMLLIEEHPGALWNNVNDVTAKVCWDGERFSLKNFTSSNRWLEEQITNALQKHYGVESFYSIKMKYDSTKMNEDTLVVNADILPEKTDSLADHVEVHLRKSMDPSSNSGWEIEEIYSGVVSKVDKIIDRVNVNLRVGYQDAKLTYVDNAEVGWNYYSDNPWSTEAERDELAQTALKELYTLTGYNVTECTYTTDGRSRFIFGKDADYIRKCIAFYSRDYGFTLCGDSVPYQGFMNARKFHYSDVQQLDSPYGKAEYSGHAGVPTWYLEHSGVYQGEYITNYEAINLDDTVYTHVKLTFDGGYYIVVTNEAIESCSEVMGPYYEMEKDTSVESENKSSQMIIKNQSYEMVIQDEVYRQTMTDFLETGVFPATTGVQCNGDPFSARYAVQDIDGDGREELLLSFPDAETIAGMTYYIYDYDRTTGKLYCQISGYPDFTIYDNGYLKGEMSHNHGRSNLDNFWPYQLYIYNSETDYYESIASVDAWQEQRYPEDEPDSEFPKEEDVNGDGVVYYDGSGDFMDNEEYKAWCAQYNQGNEIKIQWYLAGGTERSDAQEFYSLCLNEAYKQGINEPVRPGEIKNLVSATLVLDDGMYLLTDEKSLFEIQKVFSSSQEIRGGAACPFTASLRIDYENGKKRRTIYLATDSCDTWLSSGVYYQYPGFEDIEELQSYFNEHGTDISSVMATFRGDISVQNHEILSKYAFQWISWKDVSSVIENDYEEWISEEGANGRMVYRTSDGVTYILPEHFEGAEVNQIAGVLIQDKKYQLSNGLAVGMQESEIANIDMPFQRYEKDVNGRGLTSKNINKMINKLLT